MEVSRARKALLMRNSPKTGMQCAKNTKSCWEKIRICCCCKTEESTESKVDTPVTSTTTNEVKQEKVLATLEDDTKFRYSGQNFDDVSLGESEDEAPAEDSANTSQRYHKNNSKGKSKRSLKSRFTSTKRGRKSDSVYSKTSQF